MLLPFRLEDANTSERPLPRTGGGGGYRRGVVAIAIVAPASSTPPSTVSPVPPRVTRHKGSASESSNIDCSCRDSRYHFPIVVGCATTRRADDGTQGRGGGLGGRERERERAAGIAHRGYDPIKRRPPTTLDTLRTYEPGLPQLLEIPFAPISHDR